VEFESFDHALAVYMVANQYGVAELKELASNFLSTSAHTYAAEIESDWAKFKEVYYLADTMNLPNLKVRARALSLTLTHAQPTTAVLSSTRMSVHLSGVDSPFCWTQAALMQHLTTNQRWLNNLDSLPPFGSGAALLEEA
jgi:hypothetical protein